MKSTTDNPLLREKKEFLQRQSQEYKNALMGEVQELKDKSQDMGKKALVAGGAILIGYALIKAISGGKSSGQQKLLEYKGKKKKNKNTAASYSEYEDLTNNASAFDVTDVPYTETIHVTSAQHLPSDAPKKEETSIGKDIFAVVAQQITAYLIILGTRKLEEYLNAKQHASDTPSGNYIAHESGQHGGDTYVSPGAANIQSALAE